MRDARRLLDKGVAELSGLLSDLAPGPEIEGGTADVDVAFGELDELRGVDQVVNETSPAVFVVAHVVTVVFEPTGLVAPHGSTGVAGRNRSEDVEVEGVGVIHKLEDALSGGSFQGGIDLADRR